MVSEQITNMFDELHLRKVSTNEIKKGSVVYMYPTIVTTSWPQGVPDDYPPDIQFFVEMEGRNE